MHSMLTIVAYVPKLRPEAMQRQGSANLQPIAHLICNVTVEAAQTFCIADGTPVMLLPGLVLLIQWLPAAQLRS